MKSVLIIKKRMCFKGVMNCLFTYFLLISESTYNVIKMFIKKTSLFRGNRLVSVLF